MQLVEQTTPHLGLLPKVKRHIVVACLGLYLLPRELGHLPKHKFEELGDVTEPAFSLRFCQILYRSGCQ